jgi:hypothetical protein
LVSLDDLL